MVFAAILLSACNDFLDKSPDMRATIDTKDKVQKLLVSAYADVNYAFMCELASDNLIDNNSPNSNGEFYNKTSMSSYHDELFAWQDVVSGSAQDSPYYVWNGAYKAIAVANQALQAIEKLEAQGVNMDAEKAEALLVRAYYHFVLVNIFCQAYKDETLSKEDLGVYYITEPETTVVADYPRTTVAETYKHIEDDLEEALPLVSDEYYSVPKYHFNAEAAHAFAARFFLYKRDYNRVITEANKVLGITAEDAANKMFDAKTTYSSVCNAIFERNLWFDASSKGNLLIRTSNSYAFNAVVSYARYAFNRDARDYTIRGAGPCWTSSFPGMHLYGSDSNIGNFLAKMWYFFQYTDRVQGTGYPRCMHRDFTTDETLLCRAEAKIFLNDFDGALSDLQVWSQSYNVGGRMQKLTRSSIEHFYTSTSKYVKRLHNTDMSPSFTVTAAQAPWIHCVLHFRRIETLWEGLRFFDIKRYGIEIEHSIGNSPNIKTTLIWNDDRRAIQLPQEVIASGMGANPRVVLGPNAGKLMSAPSANNSDPSPIALAAAEAYIAQQASALVNDSSVLVND